jgi:glyoxylase I family protein
MSSEFVGIHHASLLVSDTGRALDFYCGVLQMQLDESRPDLGYAGAWLRVGEQQIHLLELPNPDPRQGRPSHGGRDRHLALLVGDLGRVALRLERAGLPFTRSRSGRQALFCRDPDQNALEFVQPAG